MVPTMASLSATHVILVVAVVLLLFGAQKIPALMRSLGSGMNQFKQGLKEGEQMLLTEASREEAKKAPSPVETSPRPE